MLEWDRALKILSIDTKSQAECNPYLTKYYANVTIYERKIDDRRVDEESQRKIQGGEDEHLRDETTHTGRNFGGPDALFACVPLLTPSAITHAASAYSTVRVLLSTGSAKSMEIEVEDNTTSARNNAGIRPVRTPSRWKVGSCAWWAMASMN